MIECSAGLCLITDHLYSDDDSFSLEDSYRTCCMVMNKPCSVPAKETVFSVIGELCTTGNEVVEAEWVLTTQKQRFL